MIEVIVIGWVITAIGWLFESIECVRLKKENKRLSDLYRASSFFKKMVIDANRSGNHIGL